MTVILIRAEKESDPVCFLPYLIYKCIEIPCELIGCCVFLFLYLQMTETISEVSPLTFLAVSLLVVDAFVGILFLSLVQYLRLQLQKIHSIETERSRSEPPNQMDNEREAMNSLGNIFDSGVTGTEVGRSNCVRVELSGSRLRSDTPGLSYCNQAGDQQTRRDQDEDSSAVVELSDVLSLPRRL